MKKNENDNQTSNQKDKISMDECSQQSGLSCSDSIITTIRK